MVLLEVSVNWLAVVVGAIAAMVIGFIWYSPPLFGKQWMQTMQKGEKMNMVTSMTGAFLASIFTAFILEGLIVAFNVTTVTAGLELAALVWFGFYLAMELVSLSFSRNDAKLFVINVVHHAIVLGAVSSILVLMG